MLDSRKILVIIAVMPIAPTTSAYRMADRLAGGELAAKLEKYRAAGVPWAAIGRLLRSEYGIEVGPDTLKGWGLDLGIEPVEAAS